MERALKEYCEREYQLCKRCKINASLIEKAIDRCFGAVLFCINNCFITYNEELGNWWTEEMLPKFEKLKLDK